MNLKFYFLQFVIECYPETLRAYSEDQSEKFHQDLRNIEGLYRGRWDVNILADCCWMLRRETEDGKRKPVSRIVKDKQKDKVRLKSYICVIVCVCTKAVGLEVVSDLSSQALLAALLRFISRRGCPSDIYSNNGKNFTGLENQLKALFDILKYTPVQEYAASQFIRWHFIPPYSPHFGEIWEAAVKQTKNRLLRACRAAVLNFEELSTLLCQVEAFLNSRPTQDRMGSYEWSSFTLKMGI
ncbi:hypothetical protein AVEN_169971-1 [Araneus ventricosus]|uniref:Integrase catalytic domain-containing protein n=1 Tax=Araneus ventricosus TaxID=182803 RepID=A0A4Y2LWQ3_ARAVE|nr:hypothetical protein AVEN_169971-1 [Araneus ventricosus]